MNCWIRWVFQQIWQMICWICWIFWQVWWSAELAGWCDRWTAEFAESFGRCDRYAAESAEYAVADYLLAYSVFRLFFLFFEWSCCFHDKNSKMSVSMMLKICHSQDRSFSYCWTAQFLTSFTIHFLKKPKTIKFLVTNFESDFILYSENQEIWSYFLSIH